MKRFLTPSLALLVLSLSTTQAATPPQPPQLLSLLIENSTGTYRVTVDGQGTDCAISIDHISSATKPQPLLRFVGGGFVYARPSGSARLVTVWESGVGLRVAVFTLAPNRVRKVLDEWSIAEPDILTCKNTECAILYDEKKFFAHQHQWLPATAKIYEWNGNAYVLVKTTPYSDRFTALGQLEANRNSEP